MLTDQQIALLNNGIGQRMIDKQERLIQKVNAGKEPWAENDLVDFRNKLLGIVLENSRSLATELDYRKIAHECPTCLPNTLKKIHLYEDKELGYAVILFELPPATQTTAHRHQFEPCGSLHLAGKKDEWHYSDQDLLKALQEGKDIEEIVSKQNLSISEAEKLRNILYGKVILNPYEIKSSDPFEITCVGQNLRTNAHTIVNSSTTESAFYLHFYGTFQIKEGKVQDIERMLDGNPVTAIDFTRAVNTIIPGTSIIQKASISLLPATASDYKYSNRIKLAII